MRMKGLIICFLMMSVVSLAQTNDNKGTIKVKKPETQDVFITTRPEAEAYLVSVDQMPEFPGGNTEMYNFIGKNIKYPEAERKAGISGICYVSFIVGIDGTLSDIKILKGISNAPGYDAEALRVVNLMPKWIPGKQNGVNVLVSYNLPIKFVSK
jgi:protein TonB